MKQGDKRGRSKKNFLCLKISHGCLFRKKVFATSHGDLKTLLLGVKKVTFPRRKNSSVVVFRFLVKVMCENRKKCFRLVADDDDEDVDEPVPFLRKRNLGRDYWRPQRKMDFVTELVSSIFHKHTYESTPRDKNHFSHCLTLSFLECRFLIFSLLPLFSFLPWRSSPCVLFHPFLLLYQNWLFGPRRYFFFFCRPVRSNFENEARSECRAAPCLHRVA